MGKLEGKVAIVSGSGRGIGRAVALKLAAEGASVVINDLDAAPAEQTVADIATDQPASANTRAVAKPMPCGLPHPLISATRMGGL